LLGEAMPGSMPARIWAGGALIFSAGADEYGVIARGNGDTGGIYNKITGTYDDINPGWKYYDGTQTEPDSRMEAVLGVGNCPSYEGTAYIMFYDMELTEYGNGLAGCPIKIELAPDPWEGMGLGLFEFNTALNYYTPSAFNPPACSMPLSLSLDGITTYSAVSIGKPDQNLFFVGRSGIGRAMRSEHILYQSVPVYSDGAIDYANKYNYYRDGELFDGVETSSGNFRSLFFGYPEYYSPAYADIQKIYSVRGVNHAFFLSASIVPPGFPQNKMFLGSLGYDSVRIVFDEIDLGVVGFDDLYMYRLCNPSGGVVLFKKYLLQTGGEVLSVEVNLPFAAPGQGDIYTGVVHEGIFYYAGVGTDVVEITAIELQSFTAEGRIFNVDTSHVNSGTADLNISVQNGAIAVSVGTFENVDPPQNYKAGIRIFLFSTGVGSNTYDIHPQEFIVDICEAEFRRVGLSPEFFDLSQLADKKTIGYRVSEATSARGALSALQSAFLFDFVERGYKIHAVLRGGDSIRTVARNELCMQEGGALLKSDDNTGSLLPSLLSLSYLDYSREYDVNTQYANYPSLTSSQVAHSLPIVMSSDNAAELADIFINTAWIERKKYSFQLPQTYLDLGVSDVITLPVSPGRNVDVRVDNISKGVDQIISIDASQTSYYSYLSDAKGSEGVSPPATNVTRYQQPTPIILDVPMIDGQQDFYGVVATNYQVLPAKESVLMSSNGGGQSFTEIGRFNGPGVVGQCLDDKLEEHDGLVSQPDGELRIDNLLAGEFYSVTVDEMMSGKNYIAYGVPGRWEIMCYVNATPINDGTGVLLSHFLRGMFGTEQYTGTHSVIDYVVLLDYSGNIFAPLPLQSVGIDWPIVAVNVGSGIEFAIPADPTPYRAVNLKPLSVTHPLLVRIADDWSIDFDARTRYQSNKWNTGADEVTDTIAYEVDVIRDGVVVRTIRSAVKPIIYSSAEQIADFGAVQTTLTVDIYQINNRVGRGYKLGATK